MKKIVVSLVTFNSLSSMLFADWGQFAQLIESAKAIDNEMNLSSKISQHVGKSDEIEKYKNLDKEKNISNQVVGYLKNKGQEINNSETQKKSYADYLEKVKNLDDDMNLTGKASQYFGGKTGAEIEKYKSLDKDFNLSGVIINQLKSKSESDKK